MKGQTIYNGNKNIPFMRFLNIYFMRKGVKYMIFKCRGTISKLLIIALLVSIFSGLTPGNLVYAAGGRALTAEEASITSVTLTVDGKNITPDQPNTTPISQTAKVDLTFNWKIDNVTDFMSGDYLEVDFPVDYFTGLSGIENGKLEINGNSVIGKYEFFDTGKLKLTFFDTNLLNVSGSVTITGTKFKIPASGSNPVKITFPVSGSAITYVKFAPNGVTSSVTKDGNADKALNATKIDWQIDLNKKLEQISSAVIEDKLESYLDFDAASLKVYKLNVGLDGVVSETTEELEGVTFSQEGDKLLIQLGDIDNAYRIKYTAGINAAGVKEASLTNTATLKGIMNGQSVTVGTDTKTISNPRGAIIEKSGNTDKQINPTKVDWTVYINKNEAVVTGAAIRDTIPEGLVLRDKNNDSKLDSKDIIIIPISYEGGGWVVTGSAISAEDFTATYTDNATGTDKLVIQFVQPINSAYKVEYTTNILDSAKTSFTNEANFYDVSGTEEILLNKTPVKTTVSILRGPILTKTGEVTIDYNQKYIDWTVDINRKEEIINNPVLTDNIGAGLGPAENIKIHQLIVNPDGTTKTTGEDLYDNPYKAVALSDGTNGMSISFGTAISSAYRITYRTKITDINKTGGYKNTAILAGALPSGEGIGTELGGTVKYEVIKEPSISNDIDKSSTAINYTNKTIDWKITINPKKEPMNKLKLIDTFKNGGLQLVTGSAIIMKGNELLKENIDYTITPDNANLRGGFVIDFEGGSSKHTVQNEIYTITYTTKFDRAWATGKYQPTSYINTVKGQWYEETRTGLQTKEASATRDVNDAAENNGQKNGKVVLNGTDRTEREIDWTIDTNYLSEDFSSYTLVDTFDSTYQILVWDSIKIYSYTIDATGKIAEGALVDKNTYESLGISVSDIRDGGFKVNFNNLTKPYRIKYTTKLIGQSQSEYLNTANVTAVWNDGEIVKDTLTKSVKYSPQNIENVFLTKDGKQEGSKPYIKWTVKFNSSLSYIENAVVTDKLSSKHSYVYGSFLVSEKTASGLKLVTPGEDTYSLEIKSDDKDNTQYFVLTFHMAIKTEYEITYKSKIADSAVDGAKLSNEISFNGLGVTTENKESEDEVIIQKISSGGSGTGEIGELTIIKTDAYKADERLAGAVFDIMNSQNKVIYKSLVTGDDGTITMTIDRSTYQAGSSLYLIETSAPSGYIRKDPSDPSNWTQFDYNPDDINQDIVVKNQKLREIKIVKTGSDGLQLPNASFEITGPNGYTKIVQTQADGTVTLGGLEFGEYTVVETAAPTGYQLSNETYVVNLSEADTSVLPKELNVINQNLRTIEIHKTDITGSKGLVGAKFEIIWPDGFSQEVTTGVDGKVKVSGLYFGTYTITEIQAPKGYQLSDDPKDNTMTVTISETDSSTSPIVINVKNQNLRTIEIYKTDLSGLKALSGAEFEVTGPDNFKKEVITDTDGKASISGLNFGTYTITEKQPPEGYQLKSGETVKTVTLTKDSDEVTSVVVKNEVLRSIRVIKVAENDSSIKLDGAEFELYDSNNIQIGETYTTKNGEVTIPGLAFGSYRLVETKAPTGYQLPQNPESIVEIDENSLAIVDKVIENESLKTIKVIKVDKEKPDVKLAGAEFKLLDENGVQIGGKYVTDENGEFIIKDLLIGNYKLVETKAPTGYSLPADPVTIISITYDTDNDTILPGIGNEVYRAIQITKINKNDSTVKLAGARFALYKEDKLIDDNIITNHQGIALISNLLTGDYVLKELAPPTGYQLTADNITPVKIEVGSPLITMATISNEGLRTLVIKKVDASNTAKLLPNAEFLVTGPDGYSRTVKTGTDGTVTLTDLKFGDYTIKEIKSPAGYTLNGKSETISVDASSLTFTVEIKNRVYIPNEIPVIPESTPTPTPTGTPIPTPTGTPTPEKPETVKPTPSVVPTPTVPKQPIIEVTPEDTPLGGKVDVPKGSTPDISVKPHNGKVEIDKNGKWNYIPDKGFTGKDKFTVEIKHSDGSIEEVLIEIQVDEVPLGSGGDGSVHQGVHIPKTGESKLAFVSIAAIFGLVSSVVIITGMKKRRNLKIILDNV